MRSRQRGCLAGTELARIRLMTSHRFGQQAIRVCGLGDGARLARLALCAVMFFLPVSIAGAQIAASAALVGWAWSAVRRRSRWWAREPLVLWALAFWALAACSGIWGWRPSLALPKLHRAAWFLLMAAVPDTLPDGSEERAAALRRMVLALLAGCALALVVHLGRIGWALVHVPPGVGWLFWLYHQGSMRTPQFHMVGLLFLLAAGGTGHWGLPRWASTGGWIGNAAGVLLHFKRGVWGATAGGLAALWAAGCRIRRSAALAALVVLAALACCPPVRARVCAAPRQFLERGGRWDLWTVAVPRLLTINARRYPFGLGYGAMKNHELRHSLPNIEPKLNHVHNNALQVLLETGWGGLLVWSGWMLHWLVAAARNVRRLCGTTADVAALARGTFAAACALLLNGVVEYNFGTGTVLILFAMLMGFTIAVSSVARAEPADAERRTR